MNELEKVKEKKRIMNNYVIKLQVGYSLKAFDKNNALISSVATFDKELEIEVIPFIVGYHLAVHANDGGLLLQIFTNHYDIVSINSESTEGGEK